METSRSDQDYTDLIAALVDPQPADEYRNPIDLFREAAEAIEALVKERDELKHEMHARELHHFEEEQRSAGLAAVIEALVESSERLINSHDQEWVEIEASAWDRYLNGTADALREHDAALIESLFDGVIYSWHSSYGLTVWDNEAHYDAGTPRPKPIKDWLRDRARQVREGEA